MVLFYPAKYMTYVQLFIFALQAAGLVFNFLILSHKLRGTFSILSSTYKKILTKEDVEM